ncbi:putative T6SS immunity periplasmic lipoprotein [Erwinia sp. 9145]|uniref:putative T6SS immunity periplasmic lipoprotein n=1 Tax=Erwinia sp. 9145 TaxID=1500895 RepID=UPI0012E0758A|nr:putative T6SS immunity periplasmic lipoprotein [Erwinia sp. 9145]
MPEELALLQSRGKKRTFMKCICMVPAIIFLLAGCHFGEPRYGVMKVKIENNQPCFLIPENAARAGQILRSNGVTVSRREGAKWQMISPSAAATPASDVKPGECTRWEGTPWGAGEYGTLMRIDSVSTEDTVRYLAEFYLTEDASGQLSVINK